MTHDSSLVLDMKNVIGILFCFNVSMQVTQWASHRNTATLPVISCSGVFSAIGLHFIPSCLLTALYFFAFLSRTSSLPFLLFFTASMFQRNLSGVVEPCQKVNATRLYTMEGRMGAPSSIDIKFFINQSQTGSSILYWTSITTIKMYLYEGDTNLKTYGQSQETV